MLCVSPIYLQFNVLSYFERIPYPNNSGMSLWLMLCSSLSFGTLPLWKSAMGLRYLIPGTYL